MDKILQIANPNVRINLRNKIDSQTCQAMNDQVIRVNQLHHHQSTADTLNGRPSSNSTTKFRRPFLFGLSRYSILTIILIIVIQILILSRGTHSANTFYMHWNTSNPIFRIDNTDHIIDVNKGNVKYEYDQVHIICPVYEPGTYENETERYIIYNVSKVEYETCRITNANPRIIAQCDKPYKLMFFTITFRPFTPQPGGLEFLPGNDYYFISTSSKDDLHRRIGGRCSTKNMKVVFKVCCGDEKSKENTTIPSGPDIGITNTTQLRPQFDQNGERVIPQVNNNQSNIVQNTINWPGWNNSNMNSDNIDSNSDINEYNKNNRNSDKTNMNNSNSQSTQYIYSDNSNKQANNNYYSNHNNNNNNNNNNNKNINNTINSFHPYSTSQRPILLNSHNKNTNRVSSPVSSNISSSPSNKPTKKTNEYDKHQNEVVKNEELTYNNNTPSSGKFNNLIMAITLLILLLHQHRDRLMELT